MMATATCARRPMPAFRSEPVPPLRTTQLGNFLAEAMGESTEFQRSIRQMHAAFARQAEEFNREMAPVMANVTQWVEKAQREAAQMHRTLEACWRSPAFQRQLAAERRQAETEARRATVSHVERKGRTRAPRSRRRVLATTSRVRAPDGGDADEGPPSPQLSVSACRRILGPTCDLSDEEVVSLRDQLTMFATLAVDAIPSRGPAPC